MLFVLDPGIFVKWFISMVVISGFGVGYRNSSCFVYVLELAFPWRTSFLQKTMYLLVTIKASCSEIKRKKIQESLEAINSHKESVILQVQPNATPHPELFP